MQLDLSTLVSVGSVCGILIGGISWLFKIVTRVSILETTVNDSKEMISKIPVLEEQIRRTNEDIGEMKADIKLILSLLRK